MLVSPAILIDSNCVSFGVCEEFGKHCYDSLSQSYAKRYTPFLPPFDTIPIPLFRPFPIYPL